MPDLNKVIAGLEHCRKYGTLGGNDCFGNFIGVVHRAFYNPHEDAGDRV